MTSAPHVEFRSLASACADGEASAQELERLETHLAQCEPCKVYFDEVVSLRRRLRIRPAEGDVASQHASPKPASQIAPASALLYVGQWALFTIGAVLFVLSATGFFASGEQGVDAHLLRHEAIFGFAIGLGMMVVAWRPERARGLVPVAAVVGSLMVLAAAYDVATGRAPLLGEATHILELVGFIVVWLISGGPARLGRKAIGSRNG